MQQMVPGQRWISTAEPELGIGRISKILERDVLLSFDQLSEERLYRIQNGPLTRFVLQVGDRARTAEGDRLVESVDQRDGLLYYLFSDGEFCETEILSALASGGKGLIARLLDGELDSNDHFELRRSANALRQHIESSPLRGMIGAKIDLIPHQLYIAERACSEGRLPRRLLSDEVGLGKTIEAGLIYHRLKKTRRIKRTLIIAPESLRFQWFAEMRNRFYSNFSIVDDDYCDALALSTNNEEELGDDLQFTTRQPKKKEFPNPFMAQDELLVGMDWIFATHEQELQDDLAEQHKLDKKIEMRINWLLDAQFDLIIVDEAHTIDPDNSYYSREFGTISRTLQGSSALQVDAKLENRITPFFKKSSPEYKLLFQLSRKTQGMLLLTATPVQLHPKAHFARLHLLDIARYPHFEEWLKDRQKYEELADHLTSLVEQVDSPHQPWREIAEAQPAGTPLQEIANSVPNSSSISAADAMTLLSDTVGTGRAMIRNTRKSVGGFPERQLHPYPLERDDLYRNELQQFAQYDFEEPSDDLLLNQSIALDPELFSDDERPLLSQFWIRDEKARWVAELLKTTLQQKKVLLLCGTRPTALALQQTILELTQIESEVFHERMETVERDRAAARFASPNGVSLLISSEIGSEGRNFQFAHHLVLYDLPIEPGTIEQRIGRLDRIGQRETVHIHVPYVIDSSQHRLFEWYHNALDAFIRPLMGIELIQFQFEEQLRQQIENPAQSLKNSPTSFLQQAQKGADELRNEMELGRDRLLEYNSFSPEEAQKLLDKLLEEEEENPAETLVLEALESFGADVQHGQYPNTWVASLIESQLQFEYPGLPADGVTASSDRETALLYEKVDLFTIDHPLVQGTLDLLLGGELGRIAFAITQNELPKGLYFEFSVMMESAVQPDWNLQELLYPLHFSRLLDFNGVDRPELREAVSTLFWKEGTAAMIQPFKEELRQKLPELQKLAFKAIQSEAVETLSEMVDNALQLIDREIHRLLKLKESNERAITRRIEQLQKRKESVRETFSQPDLRLDGLRLIWSQ